MSQAEASALQQQQYYQWYQQYNYAYPYSYYYPMVSAWAATPAESPERPAQGPCVATLPRPHCRDASRLAPSCLALRPSFLSSHTASSPPQWYLPGTLSADRLSLKWRWRPHHSPDPQLPRSAACALCWLCRVSAAACS